MKTIWYTLLLAVAAVMASCQSGSDMKLEVSNTTEWTREAETVEIPWTSITKALGEVAAGDVCVRNAEGTTLLSQVLYNKETTPQALIFQVSLAPKSSAIYYIAKGTPVTQPSMTYGRFVPERKDDYAWENNKVAFRMYGPALQATGEISNGIDIWAKSTDSLVINKWYKEDLAGIRSYHNDNGEGLDFYKVGRTLGAGALAPYINNQLILGDNFVSQTTLDNGPLRTTFELQYAPSKVDGKNVVEVRRVSIDANSYFNRIESDFIGAGAMKVAVGIVKRPEGDGFVKDEKDGWVAYHDTPNPDHGSIYIGVIVPNTKITTQVEHGHVLAIFNYTAPCVYYAGGAWSKAAFPVMTNWYDYVAETAQKINNPLVVKVK